MMKYYIELQDQEKEGIIDCYGYENSAIFWTKGFAKEYSTKNIQETVTLIDRVVKNLVNQGCSIINKEDKTF